MLQFLWVIIIIIATIQASFSSFKDDENIISIPHFRAPYILSSLTLNKILRESYPEITVTENGHDFHFDTKDLKDKTHLIDFKDDLAFACQYNEEKGWNEIKLPLENIFNNFWNYIPLNKTQEQLVTSAKDFIDSENQKASLFITGPPGTGKTHIAISVAKELYKKGKKILYYQPTFSSDSLLSEMNNKEDLQYYNVYILDKLKRPKYREMSVPFWYSLGKDQEWQNQKQFLTYLFQTVLSQSNAKIIIIDNDSYQDFFKVLYAPKELPDLTDSLKNLFTEIKVEA